MRLSQEQAIERYGQILQGHWANEARWCHILQVPEGIQKSLINSVTGKPCDRIYCNSDMVPALLNVFQAILNAGLESHLKTFDGCFMIRDVRAEPGKLSCHAYALAIDLNASENELGTRGNMDPGIVASFKAQGFAWGGDFTRRDPMHFSFAWE